MPKHGKRYREAYAKVDRERSYEPREAVRLIKELQVAKFVSRGLSNRWARIPRD